MSPPAAVDIEVKGETDTSSVVVPDPLTVDGVKAWRAKTTVPTGVAAAASSDMFKSPVRNLLPLCFLRAIEGKERWCRIARPLPGDEGPIGCCF